MAEHVCSRCGEVRVVGKIWTVELEHSGRVSKIVHTQMICPNGECQVKLDGELAKATEKREERAKLKAEQWQERLNRYNRSNSDSKS